MQVRLLLATIGIHLKHGSSLTFATDWLSLSRCEFFLLTTMNVAGMSLGNKQTTKISFTCLGQALLYLYSIGWEVAREPTWTSKGAM